MKKKFNVQSFVSELGSGYKDSFENQKIILSFQEFLDLVSNNPLGLVRNAAQYFKEMIEYYGVEEENKDGNSEKVFKLFKRDRRRGNGGIIGQEKAHEQLFQVLEQFVRQGKVDKLILLHGPNGSSKSSMAESLALSLEDYSKKDEGAVYSFNWVFPNDNNGKEGLVKDGHTKRIGFGDSAASMEGVESLAHLKEEDISCKLPSEVRENPIFILPVEERVCFYKSSLKNVLKREIKDSEVPTFLKEGGLSSKNKKIFDSLLAAYKGDITKVFKHIQVERFYFSSRYRLGISTVEPQMHVDALDKQLTLESNLQNLPPVIQNIRLFEPSGHLIDANRGFIEYSDLLKRPVDAFKYLLSCIETMNIKLTSGIVDLDLIFIASTNEKYLDAFKKSPDWSSFKARMELVRVPYLLSWKQEKRIYEEDIKIIEYTKKIAPYSIELLAKWAVLTRLRTIDPSKFSETHRNLVSKIDPYDKLALYEKEKLSSNFNGNDIAELRKLLSKIKKEGQRGAAYEGRFGASPRELKMILYFASQHQNRDQVSALSILEELEKLINDKSVYDYLQFEIQGGFHDVSGFIKHLKNEYFEIFSSDFLKSLNLFEEEQYDEAFNKYLKHVMAYIKKERVFNELTQKYEKPDESFMKEIEELLGDNLKPEEFRQSLVSKLAGWRVDNPKDDINIFTIFAEELKTISNNIYVRKKPFIEKVRDSMITYGNADYGKIYPEVYQACEETFNNLEKNFGYSRYTTWESLAALSGKEIK